MTLSGKLRHHLRRRLLVPLLRGRHAPEQAARGVMVGLALAFTPTFGLRMPLVLLVWLVSRHVLGWHFSLLPALAFTWVTNVLVTVPVYAGFYVTGQLLLGRWPDLSGIDALAERALRFDPTVFIEGGLVLWLGALPWAILMGCLGYRVSLRLLEARARRSALRGRTAMARLRQGIRA